MSATDTLLAHNRSFAEDFKGADLPIMPRTGTVVITCLDARVDPAHIFGLDLGDAVVLRNVGGRVTRDVRSQLAMLSVLSAAEGAPGSPNIVVMHHTDCGTSRFANPELAAKIAAAAQIEQSAVAALVVDDPAATAAADVAQLRSVLPPTAEVTGMAYDVRSGEVTVVS